MTQFLVILRRLRTVYETATVSVSVEAPDEDAATMLAQQSYAGSYEAAADGAEPDFDWAESLVEEVPSN
jgi:hypothetical protein